MNQDNYPEIIARVEEARRYLALNKSRFAASIGMKPQTYNNFIGAQGSKPNVALIVGAVSRFNINPLWLLLGEGPMFREPPSKAADGPPNGAPSGSDNGTAAKIAEARYFLESGAWGFAAAAYDDAGCENLAALARAKMCKIELPKAADGVQ